MVTKKTSPLAIPPRKSQISNFPSGNLYNKQKNAQWIQMVFLLWRVELEGTWKSSLRRISYNWLCQPHLTIKISDSGEIHNLHRRPTSNASSSLTLDKNAFLIFTVNLIFLPHAPVIGTIDFLLLRNLLCHIRVALRVWQ